MTERLQRIDAFRLYCMLGVICVHLQFEWGLSNSSPLGTLVSVVSIVVPRCIVPFFCIVAGYFVGGKIVEAEAGQTIAIAFKHTRRLGIFLCFWSLFYAIEHPSGMIATLNKQPILFLFEGTRYHLWFVVSLILTIWLFALWPFQKRSYSFLVLGAILFAIGLLGGSYRFTSLGLNLGIPVRNAVFFTTLFFAIGVRFHLKLPRVTKRRAFCLAVFGLCVFCLEAYHLRSLIDPRYHTYLMGTVPWGIGFALFVLGQKDTSLDRFFGRYGNYVLGIYGCHMACIDLLRPIGMAFPGSLFSVAIFTPVIFVFSFLIVFFMSRSPLRPVVV